MKCIVIAALLGWCTLGCGAESAGAVQLLEVGDFHGDDVSVTGDGPWFGLVAVRGGYDWKRVRLAIQAVRDEILDEPGQATGKRVSVSGPSPVFLAQGVVRAGSGKVKSCDLIAKSAEEATEQVRQYGLNGQTYRLRWSGPLDSPNAAAKPAQLVLESGGMSQVLYSWPEGFIEGHCEIIWAGDVDGDGRLDLYLYLGDRSNVVQHTLMLSGGRKAGELVRKVAAWTTVGC